MSAAIRNPLIVFPSMAAFMTFTTSVLAATTRLGCAARPSSRITGLRQSMGTARATILFPAYRAPIRWISISTSAAPNRLFTSVMRRRHAIAAAELTARTSSSWRRRAEPPAATRPMRCGMTTFTLGHPKCALAIPGGNSRRWPLFACFTLRNRDGLFWNRWGNACSGGLRSVSAHRHGLCCQ
jgi:hypothetical protein